ncbi:MAG: gfo/Idh/MocA family oxidoreductase, partial [Ruminococcaceae bacterium]|nr:gfo/Idh/MocA family oxidoreductase [Oscillospiraceae bacterium]
MKGIRVGIIGMGYIGESHIEALRRIGMCEIAAIADTNAALAEQKAQLYGIEKVYPTVDALLADDTIDAVHNCTPNFLHR